MIAFVVVDLPSFWIGFREMLRNFRTLQSVCNFFDCGRERGYPACRQIQHRMNLSWDRRPQAQSVMERVKCPASRKYIGGWA